MMAMDMLYTMPSSDLYLVTIDIIIMKNSLADQLAALGIKRRVRIVTEG
jgi:hypothetical protein